jgi:RimJ/RimL family protein N-acetyltransferase
MNDVINFLNGDRNPSMYGILTGICKGEHWSLNEDSLVLDVAYSYCVGGCGVVGRIPFDKTKQARVFFERVFSSLKEKNICEFEFSSEDNELCAKILDIFSDKELNSEEEYSYRKADKCVVNTATPSYTVLEVNRSFMKMIDIYLSADMLLERLNNSWYCQEDFFRYSKCFIAIQGREIVGIIFGSARFLNIIDVDIEVLQEHRGKGLATTLTSYFVDACISNGWTVQWDCVESNIRSRAVAEKCGFQLLKKRPCHWFTL